MVIWDFNEDKNYKLVDGYKVLNFQDSKKASKLLKSINVLILRTFESIDLNHKKTPEIDLLLNTPFDLQEMQLEKDQGKIKFEGLNKPKEVHPTNLIEIGEDGKLRAKYRRIFLTLRDETGKLKTINNIKRIVIHELTHTALNHVTWRDDNHPKKFHDYYNIIKKYIN
jgi:hypothetical protein